MNVACVELLVRLFHEQRWPARWFEGPDRLTRDEILLLAEATDVELEAMRNLLGAELHLDALAEVSS